MNWRTAYNQARDTYHKEVYKRRDFDHLTRPSAEKYQTMIQQLKTDLEAAQHKVNALIESHKQKFSPQQDEKFKQNLKQSTDETDSKATSAAAHEARQESREQSLIAIREAQKNASRIQTELKQAQETESLFHQPKLSLDDLSKPAVKPSLAAMRGIRIDGTSKKHIKQTKQKSNQKTSTAQSNQGTSAQQ
jgi:hypothetical protein